MERTKEHVSRRHNDTRRKPNKHLWNKERVPIVDLSWIMFECLCPQERKKSAEKSSIEEKTRQSIEIAFQLIEWSDLIDEKYSSMPEKAHAKLTKCVRLRLIGRNSDSAEHSRQSNPNWALIDVARR